MTNINWQEVIDEADAESAPVPVGSYDVRVVKSEAAMSSNGNPMIKMTCEVQGGPYDKRFLWTNLVAAESNPTSMRMFLRKVRAFGITPEWLVSSNAQMPQIAEAVLNRDAVAEVEHREWQGETRADIKKLSPKKGPGGGPESGQGAPPTPTPAGAPPIPVVDETAGI